MTKRRGRSPESALRNRTLFKERWKNTSVGFDPEQGAVIRRVTDRHNISLSEVLDLVLRRYLPTHFVVDGRPLRWPRANRARRTWHIHEHKVTAHPYTDLQVYGFTLSHEQRAVMDEALAQIGARSGALSALVEEAFVIEFPVLFQCQFPRHRRRRVLSLPRLNSADA